MLSYNLIPIIDVFHKQGRNDNLIVRFELKYVPIEEICNIFGQEILTHGGGFLIKKEHEKLLKELAGVDINTKECDAFISICQDNDPSKY